MATTTGPGSSGPATATVGSGVEFGNVRFQNTIGASVSFDIDILASGLVEIVRTGTSGIISQSDGAFTVSGPDMLLDFMLATGGTMLTGATLVNPFVALDPLNPDLASMVEPWGGGSPASPGGGISRLDAPDPLTGDRALAFR